MKRVEQKDKTNQVQTAINRIKVLFEILLMGGISFFLIGTHEHFYQVEKDYSFYKAVFISILLIILIRNISFKEIRVIVSLSICVLGIIVDGAVKRFVGVGRTDNPSAGAVVSLDIET